MEWDILAAWICQHSLYSDNIVWLIQVRPHLLLFVQRSYSVLLGVVHSAVFLVCARNVPLSPCTGDDASQVMSTMRPLPSVCSLSSS